MINSLRMILAEKLLYWSICIAPNNKDGKRLAIYLQAYFVAAMAGQVEEASE